MEPIALIGMSCRLPGADNTDEYWSLLKNQENMIQTIPADRWNPEDFDHLDYTVSRFGSFLSKIREFDAQFFGISPREASKMDPQQRLLMETTWEAFEHAGILPATLEGQNVGVFVGAMNADYGTMQMQDYPNMDAFAGPGGQLAVTANRISYFYDFRGPSLSIDTACSSSLVAIHQACQSLRLGDSSPLAIACGVNVILSPAGHVFFSKAGVLSADGNIRTFDAAANGFSRGEGVGVVVLKRLSDAERDGDPIIAVIRGSAVNQDGRTNGIMAPNRFSQEKLLREAYKNAGVNAGDIQYVELHGTGTLLGDPIEANALGTVLKEGRSSGEPCLVGSVKSNIGHLESAAGIAGFIKVALMLKHKQMVPSLHFEQSNPYIPFDSIPLQVATELAPWHSRSTRLAAVSGFGFGGTNAHVILEEAPVCEKRSPEVRIARKMNSYLLPLSAKSEFSLRRLVEAYLERVTSAEHTDLANLCYSAAVRRTHHPLRIAFVFQDIPELISQLTSYLENHQTDANIFTGKAGYAAQRVCFIFSGQGPQWWGMARDLLDTDEVFREAVMECNVIYQSLSGISLIEEWQRDASASRMNETIIAQPTLFALHVGLAAKLLALGVRPDGLIGHSLGEVATAYLSKMLSLKDALNVIYYRSSNMQAVTGQGKMLAVLASESEVAQIIAASNLAIDIAAVNSPQSVVVSGREEELQIFENELHSHSASYAYLPVDYAFHGRQMLPFADKLKNQLDGISVMPPATPVYSTLTGKRSDDQSYRPDYWGDQMCNSVLFKSAVTEALHAGNRVFIEISPNPVLTKPIMQILDANKKAAEAFFTLKSSENDDVQLHRLISQLYCQGLPISWNELYKGGQFSQLPDYPWQHEPFWLDQPNLSYNLNRIRSNSGGLLGSKENLPAPLNIDVWKTTISERKFPWVNDHIIQNAVVLPGAAYIDMVMSAMHQKYGTQPFRISQLKTVHALFLEPEREYELQLTLKYEDHAVSFVIYGSREDHGATEWLEHARGTVTIARPDLMPPSLDITGLLSRISVQMSNHQFYKTLSRLGFSYGGGFQNVQQLWTSHDHTEVVSRVELAGWLAEEMNQYSLHPALLDACGHSLLAVEPSDSEVPAVFMPVSVDEVHRYGKLPDQVWCYARKRAADTSADRLFGDVTVCNENGKILVVLEGLCFQKMITETAESLLYTPRWIPYSDNGVKSTDLSGLNLIFAEQVESGVALTRALHRKGMTNNIVVLPGPAYRELEPNIIEMDMNSQDQMFLLLQFAERIGLQAANVVLFRSSQLNLAEAWDDHDAQSHQKLFGAVQLTQQLLNISSRHQLQLWIVTNGGVVVNHGELMNPLLSPYWGYAKSLEAEMPELFGGMIDIQRDLPLDEAVNQAAEGLSHPVAGTFAAYRNGVRYESKLLPLTDEESEPALERLVHTGTILITGGLGGIGLALATWLAHQGAAHIALIGRRELPHRNEWHCIKQDDSCFHIIKSIENIEEIGTKVFLGSADVTNLDSLQQVMNQLNDLDYPSIRHVYHLAGIAQSQSIALTDEGTWESIVAPKIEGTMNLHRLLMHEPLDAFILFSSAASIISSPMLSAYASGNAFLDAFAHYRQSLGMKATSINWGPWAEVGMASDYTSPDSNQFGALKWIEPDEGFRILQRILGYAHPQISAVSFADAVEQLGDSSLSPGMYDDGSGSANIEQYLIKAVATTLHIQQDRVDPNLSLLSIGFDSLLTMELKRKIDSAFRIQLPLVTLLQGPSITKLGTIVQQQEVAAASQQDSTPAFAGPEERIAGRKNAEQLLESLDDLTDEEVEQLLQQFQE